MLRGNVLEDGRNRLESFVIGSEDGKVGRSVKRRSNLRVFADGADKGGEASSLSGGGNILRWGEDGVNNMDDAAGKVSVLPTT